ncbi:cerberus-like isoform X1 [Anguilla rostrata]|uniref:cerberus-like isoform X1 n=2 Tax=Anguilla rostrata TaxID=7938 RepID=UPI0030CA9269
MLLFPLTFFLLVSAAQTEMHGWSIRGRYLGSKLGDMQRKVASYLTSEMDPETSASAAHLKRAMEELLNQTRPADGKTVRSVRPEHSVRKFGVSRNQAKEALLSHQRPTPPADNLNPTDAPSLKNAKKFWNHFMLRRRSDFQSILPIRNNEVHQEKCRKIPFLQRVVHEDCETLVLKNHLCFGRCSSVHVPSSEEGRYTFCSYCSPVKFSRKTVHLKCAGDTRVAKAVTMVEDCQCEVQRGRHSHHHNGPVLIDPSLFGNQA